ncbi:MAG TPA: MBL fold metallo-hydrolase [archaeon]|nr:MBL fold metallo-hydrolase [archaeon]
MKVLSAVFLVSVLAFSAPAGAKETFETDFFNVRDGILMITFVGHGSLMFQYNGAVIHVDPVSREADYSKMPKADLVLITHEHGDHLDPNALGKIKKDNTVIVLNGSSAEKIKEGIVMKNGDVKTIQGLKIEAVPAYNIVGKRPGGVPYHPKGNGNGYIITFGDKRVYIAGDTENIPEMKNLKDIEIAFLPMNLPYTMSPEMAAEAARSFKPKVLYPYHYGDTDAGQLIQLLKDAEIEVRIRQLQ